MSIKLLLYDQEVIMTPELTLPHPDLQYDLLTLRLSSEVWSRYEHPVLKKTLGELSDLRVNSIDHWPAQNDESKWSRDEVPFL
ncbi:MAG: hypothetical protein IPK04_09785 [Bdellovibrionales bacterium]|nr:hypothetical protein [Bdellovibrionales bacterium]